MPLFYQHNINQGTKLGHLHIEEPDLFPGESPFEKRDVSHPFKRLQHLPAATCCLFFPRFPVEEIRIADTRQPFLESESIIFLFRTAGGMLLHRQSNSRVGVDIELITPRIGRSPNSSARRSPFF